MPNPYPLGRRVDHDPRSRNFAYRKRSDAPITSVQHHSSIPILDQGSLGSCTGNAAVGCLGYDPFHETLGETTTLDESLAVAIYSEATFLDQWPGEYPPTDTGSSGLAAAKALKNRGLISGYLWMFSFLDVLGALMEKPLIVGTAWHEEMFYPDSTGTVLPMGPVVGGHEYILDGYDVSSGMLYFRNSWGPNWGYLGNFRMHWTDFEGLLLDDGDATAFVPIPEPVVPSPVEPEKPGCLFFV